MSKISFIIAYVLSTSLGLIVLKLSTTSGLPINFIDGNIILNLNIYTIIGILSYGLSFLIYMYLLSKFSLGYIVPLSTALVYVVIFTASFVIFHEVFTMVKILGIGLIVSGLMLLNVKGGYENKVSH